VLPRKESLAQAGKEATTLVLGVIPLLIVAGIIEAFVSPTGIAVWLKFGLAGGLFTLLVVYLFGLSMKDGQISTRSIIARTDTFQGQSLE
jgi:hypothetical protein